MIGQFLGLGGWDCVSSSNYSVVRVLFVVAWCCLQEGLVVCVGFYLFALCCCQSILHSFTIHPTHIHYQLLIRYHYNFYFLFLVFCFVFDWNVK